MTQFMTAYTSGYDPLWNEHIGMLERIMKERGIAATPGHGCMTPYCSNAS
jgi:hypothetical protein